MKTNQGVVALSAELDDNAVRLKEASDLEGRFLSYMSHAFRTPLGSIIAPESIDSWFQDYVQVDSAIQKRLRGTGLGLSLSRKLALILGGDVSVASQLGRGSVFSVTIPLTIPGHRPPAADGQAGAGPAGGDDD